MLSTLLLVCVSAGAAGAAGVDQDMLARVATPHTVLTKDGFTLQLHRVRRPPLCARKLAAPPPVLMAPGLLLSGDCFVDAGPRAALALLLAARCRDVWLLSQRGSLRARGPSWKFSYQDMALKDQPAAIKFVLRETGAAQLDYVGYSQGGAAFGILCSLRAEWCSRRLRRAVLLAPASRMLHTTSTVFRVLTRAAAVRVAAGESGETLAGNSTVAHLLRAVCRRTVPCRALFRLIEPPRPSARARRSVSSSTLRALSAHFPGGTSLHNLAHFRQALDDTDFRLFGTDGAGAVVNLSLVRVPTAVLAGAADRMVDVQDARWFSSRLPRLVEFRVMSDPDWNHFDFSYSRHGARDLLPLVLGYLNWTEPVSRHYDNYYDDLPYLPGG